MRVEVAVVRRKLQKRSFHEIERGALGVMMFSARKRKRLTQAQLASQIDRDRPWVSDVETGKITHVPDEDLEAVAPVLDLEMGTLRRARARATPRAVSATAPPGGTPDRDCGACGSANPWDANYCANCGTRLPPEMACPSCGRLILADSKFCAYCGESVASPLPAT